MLFEFPKATYLLWSRIPHLARDVILWSIVGRGRTIIPFTAVRLGLLSGWLNRSNTVNNHTSDFVWVVLQPTVVVVMICAVIVTFPARAGDRTCILKSEMRVCSVTRSATSRSWSEFDTIEYWEKESACLYVMSCQEVFEYNRKLTMREKGVMASFGLYKNLAISFYFTKQSSDTRNPRTTPQLNRN